MGAARAAGLHVLHLLEEMPAVAERLRRAYPALLEWDGVGSIPANSDTQNVPSFRRLRFEMKLSPFWRRSSHRGLRRTGRTTKIPADDACRGLDVDSGGGAGGGPGAAAPARAGAE